MATIEDRNVEFVRSLWKATQRRGIAPALRLVDPETEWSLHFVPGRVFDTEELGDFLAKIQGERELLAAHLLRLRSKGDVVLASGSFRWGSVDGGLSDFQGHWVYEFRYGRLASGRSYRTLSEAVEAFDAVHERSGSTSSAE
jgi:ketosteroid isomerase-like protein